MTTARMKPDVSGKPDRDGGVRAESAADAGADSNALGVEEGGSARDGDWIEAPPSFAASGAGGPQTGAAVATLAAGGLGTQRKRTLFERLEAYVSRLSARNNFWHSVFSLIWLPFAFRSGIKIRRLDRSTFTDNQEHGKKTVFEAILPFKKFNKNWYNAMAGAALLGNAEIAGGMFVFGVCGADYTVVCKHLEYRFLRPCFGPAVYRIFPKSPLDPLVATGQEFNVTLDMDVVEQIKKPGAREKRVGKVVVTFHVTPKAHQKSRKERRRRKA